MPTTIKRICKECSSSVTPVQKPGIGCCICPDFYHFKCANLQDQDIKYIESNPVGWLCPKCNQPHVRSSIISSTASEDLSDISSVPGTSKGNSGKLGEDSRKTAENNKQTKSTKATSVRTSLTNVSTTVPKQSSICTRPSVVKKSAVAKQKKSPGKDKPKPQSAKAIRLTSLQQLAPSTSQIADNFEKSVVIDSPALKADIEQIQNKLSELEAIIKELQEESLKKDKIIENFARYKAARRVEIQGLKLNKINNPVSVLKALGEDLNCPLLPSDINQAFFLDSSSKGLRLVVEFVVDYKKELFIKAGKLFNRSGSLFVFDNKESKIFVNQHLTARQKTLLYDSKEFAKQHNFKFVWIHRNQILIKKDEKSVPIYVRGSDDLQAILEG
jgi:hypothetical protein